MSATMQADLDPKEWEWKGTLRGYARIDGRDQLTKEGEGAPSDPMMTVHRVAFRAANGEMGKTPLQLQVWETTR